MFVLYSYILYKLIINNNNYILYKIVINNYNNIQNIHDNYIKERKEQKT
jgi:hypothetical protein